MIAVNSKIARLIISKDHAGIQKCQEEKEKWYVVYQRITRVSHMTWMQDIMMKPANSDYLTECVKEYEAIASNRYRFHNLNPWSPYTKDKLHKFDEDKKTIESETSYQNSKGELSKFKTHHWKGTRKNTPGMQQHRPPLNNVNFPPPP